MSDNKIKELLSVKVLKNISDYAVQTVLRQIIFSDKNNIDWQDAYEIILKQMPELTLASEYVSEDANDVRCLVGKILEGADVRQVFCMDVKDN